VLVAVLLGLATFACAALYEAVETLYTRAAAQLDETRAPALAVAMYAIGCVGFVALARASLWYLVPEAAGVFLGSRVAIRAARRRTSQST